MPSKNKVIVVWSTNNPPQEELDQVLTNLDGNWRVVSATTSIVPHGSWSQEEANDAAYMAGMSGVVAGRCKHLYFCTTVVLEAVE